MREIIWKQKGWIVKILEENRLSDDGEEKRFHGVIVSPQKGEVVKN